MDFYTLMISFFILSGAGIMIYSIRQFRSTIQLLQAFYIRKSKKLSRMITLHLTMMAFFFFGYIGFLFFFLAGADTGIELITALVFFWGAIFVAMGNGIHKGMLSTIQESYKSTVSISIALKEEQEKLLTINRQLLQTEDVTILALAYQAELRDGETGRHVTRAAEYTGIIARQLKKDSTQSSYLTDQYIVDLVKSAPLHDIGKVAIPDQILQKKGPFIPQEFEIMKQHCQYGADIICKAQEKLKFRSFLTIAVQLTLSHHEKWDGSGYPAGLAGKSIPLSARIMALADVYDALRTKRYYKEAFSHETSCQIIREERGRHFDPEIVEAFFAVEKEFERISLEQAD
ncbi:HD domain-containing phosphohydrolase [Desulfoluna sp.]|uniref:HD-GYP domain-containing protein n=1 Tax=Desulfoluna sp. TaxID=2045199 RepID=UPI0026334E53|nr:HD domain-containing phosphohydrolase [Desulfoluna sp.]